MNHCENCRYYVQHYIYCPGDTYLNADHGYVPIKLGHCRFPRIRPRRRHDWCEHFSRRDEA